MTTPRSNDKWYPTEGQLGTPQDLERAFRELLTQHYALQQHVVNLTNRVTKPGGAASGPPPGSGPSDSMLLGLRVLPTDTATLSNGATLKYNKSQGNFQFS